MSYPFIDPATEDRLLDEVAIRTRRMAALRSSVTPRVASLAAAYADAYPWMEPSAISSFVQAGLPPDLPQVQATAELAAQKAAEEGQFTDSAEDVPDAWYETLVNTMFGWAKPVVRTGFTILATPWEELSALLSSAGVALFDRTQAGEHGLLSDIGGTVSALIEEVSDPGKLISDFWDNYTNKAARSTGLLALGDLLSGKPVDLGEGWLPGGEIMRERERDKWRLTLDGTFVTPGRLFARTVTAPGTTAYHLVSGTVDAAGAIFADPAAIGLKALSGAAKATRTFQATGIISGLRKTVAPEIAVNHYLASETGRRLVKWLTDTTDIDDVWQAIGRANIGVARRLAESRAPDEVFQILSDTLGTVIRERPTASFMGRVVGRTLGGEYGALFGGGAAVRRSADSTRSGWLHRAGRLLDDVPGQSINIHDIDDAAVTLDQWMRNAGLDNARRKEIIARVANAEPGDLFEITEDAATAVEELLKAEWGLRGSEARRLTRMYEDLGDDLHTFDVDDLGRHVDVLAPLRVNVEGQVLDVSPMPGMIAELVNDVIPLPSARAIRAQTPIVRKLKRLYDSGLWKGTIDALDAAMSVVWKPLQLFRFAYPVRVIAEEQVRMAAAGYDSLLRHPMSAIAWITSLKPESKLAKFIASHLDDVSTPAADLLGEVWDDVVEHQAALARGAAGWAGLPGEILTGKFVKARRGDAGFFRGWATELAHQANDPVMRRVAGGLSAGDLRSIGKAADELSTFDDVVEWFWSGSGKAFRQRLGRIKGREALLTDRSAAARYLQQNYYDRLQRFTRGNPDLVEAVAKGKLGDLSFRGIRNEGKIARALEDSYASAAPNFVKMEVTLTGSTSGQRTLHRLNRATDVVFDHLMAKPTNQLSRSPVFRQAYWQRVEEVIGFADRATQEAIVKAARDAGMGREFLERLASKILKGEGSKLTSLDDVDTLAKGFALSETKRLLYDLTKRSQVFDALRVVFPFGEAWKEILTTWTRLVRQNPQILRRFQQGLHGARTPSLLGRPDTQTDSGQGFFSPDPQTGEEVFYYPAGWLGKLLGLQQESGAGLRLPARAAGLNIVATSVLPGFGPAIQIPASVLIPDTPAWDDLREILLPFGETPSPIDAFTPAWLDKLRTALEDPEKHRLFGNTVIDVMRALQVQGGYGPGDADRLYRDAVPRARVLYLVRALAQFVAPTGPSFGWTTTDVEGNVVPVKLLADDLRKLTEQYGGDRTAAFSEWVRRYGTDNVLAVVGKSVSVVERPVTEKGDAWLRAHQDLESKYPLTIGYFAPEPAVGEFDYTAYLRQFETGARRAVTPKEQLALANDFLGRVQFEQAKRIAALRPGPESAAWLAQVRERIAEEYPGFDGWEATRVRESRPSVDQKIAEIREAVKDPVLAATDAGKGALIYLSAIAAAERMTKLLPGGVRRYQQAKTARPIRDWLRSVARSIVEEHPDFARLWTGVFELELADDGI